jgi:hypothetical protein
MRLELDIWIKHFDFPFSSLVIFVSSAICGMASNSKIATASAG